MNRNYKTPRTDWPLVIGVTLTSLLVLYLMAKEFVRWTN